MSETPDRLNAFVKTAQGLFLKEKPQLSDEPSPEFTYFDVPVRLTPALSKDEGGHRITPLSYLSGIMRRHHSPVPLAVNPGGPKLTILVGEYGVGKTELLKQLCLHVASNTLNGMRVLPIRLLACDRKRKFKFLKEDIKTKPDKFCQFLFQHIADQQPWLGRQAIKNYFYKTELLPQIYSGNILLALDALDELMCTSAEHDYFLDGLMGMLRSGHSPNVPPGFRVILSMRSEYTVAINDAKGQKTAARIKDGSQQDLERYLEFLSLEFFPVDLIIRYIKDTLGLAEEDFDDVKRYPRLRDLLKRPILLKIFVELLHRKPHLRPSGKWHKYEFAGELIHEYLDLASISASENEREELLSPYVWDVDKLAILSLRHYRRETDIQIPALKSCLRLRDSKETLIEKARLEIDDILFAIHRCPFLTRTESGVEFIHKCFEEFLVAKGVHLRLLKCDPRPFDDLALEPSASRFLRWITERFHPGDGKIAWQKNTQRAHGISQRQWRKWDREKKQRLARKLKLPNAKEPWNEEQMSDLLQKELDEIRTILLNYRNDPESLRDEPTLPGILPIIEKLLTLDADLLPPRYRAYTYEAIRVYFFFNSYESNTKAFGLAVRFEKRLSEEWKKLELYVEEREKKHANFKRNRDLDVIVDTVYQIGKKLDLPFAFEWVAIGRAGHQHFYRRDELTERARKRA